MERRPLSTANKKGPQNVPSAASANVKKRTKRGTLVDVLNVRQRTSKGGRTADLNGRSERPGDVSCSLGSVAPRVINAFGRSVESTEERWAIHCISYIYINETRFTQLLHATIYEGVSALFSSSTGCWCLLTNTYNSRQQACEEIVFLYVRLNDCLSVCVCVCVCVCVVGVGDNVAVTECLVREILTDIYFIAAAFFAVSSAFQIVCSRFYSALNLVLGLIFVCRLRDRLQIPDRVLKSKAFNFLGVFSYNYVILLKLVAVLLSLLDCQPYGKRVTWWILNLKLTSLYMVKIKTNRNA